MITIEFRNDTSARAYGDFECETRVASFIASHQKNKNVFATTSTEMLISAFRLAIAEEKLAPTDLTIVFDGKNYQFDENSELIGDWPEGLGDTKHDIFHRIFNARYARHQREKQEKLS